jgi:hypothetical protein
LRALDTVNWLIAQLPVNAQFQVITFNTEAKSALEGTSTQWLEVADTPKLEAISLALRDKVPAGGTSLHNAFDALSTLPSPPDNVFLITDGLPTQGDKKPKKYAVTGPARERIFWDAIKLLPNDVPVNVILLPMVGDPMAAQAFWQLAIRTSGSFLSPSSDWP